MHIDRFSSSLKTEKVSPTLIPAVLLVWRELAGTQSHGSADWFSMKKPSKIKLLVNVSTEMAMLEWGC